MDIVAFLIIYGMSVLIIALSYLMLMIDDNNKIPLTKHIICSIGGPITILYHIFQFLKLIYDNIHDEITNGTWWSCKEKTEKDE